MITIALSKGRIFDEALALFAKLEISPVDDLTSVRKLILETNRPDVRFIVVRATDVPTYVGYGVADLGVVGRDILMEHSGLPFYEPLDLRIAKCRMAVAGVKNSTTNGVRRIATKYVKTTINYFAHTGLQVEIVKLYGSMELAAVLGLSDQIVDLVDTGDTLKANGLEMLEKIADISSWLIVNKASMKMNPKLIQHIIGSLKEVID